MTLKFLQKRVVFMSNYDNVYKVNAYYYKDGFPKDLEYHGIFQSYSKAFQRLLKEAEEVELFVIPDADQKGYVIDIATGISIPVMSYQHYTNHKSVLRQKDRLESSMDPSISFCVFEDGAAFSDTISSPDMIDQYVKAHHGVEHYNMILQYANQNVYLVNPNQDKKMMNAVNEEVIPSVTNSMTFLQLTGNIQSMVTELPIEMQAVYYQRLSKILKQYDESSSTLDGVALDMTLSSFVTELDKLQSEIQSVKEGSSKLQVYTPATFQSFLEYLNVLDNPVEKIEALFQEMQYVSSNMLSNNLLDQITIVDLFVSNASSIFSTLSVDDRKKYWDMLDQNYQSEFIISLENKKYPEAILLGETYSKPEKDFEYFNQLLAFDNNSKKRKIATK